MYKNVCILNFSDRISGNCSNICSYIANYHKKSNIRLFDIPKLFSPCSNCDYECLKPGVVCPNLTQHQNELLEYIAGCDITYYVVPNFCGFPCASYFAFNERTVGYFNMDRERMHRYMAAYKRFIIVSNTESATFANAMAQQAKEPDILYLKTSKYGMRSTAGDLLESDAAVADLQQFLDKDPSVSI